MREMGLAAVQKRAYKRTTINDEHAQVFEDQLARNFDPADYCPGQALVSDTYLRTGQGWLDLATIIDLATRMVVGWQLADHMRTSLVIDALDMARNIPHRNLRPTALQLGSPSRWVAPESAGTTPSLRRFSPV